MPARSGVRLFARLFSFLFHKKLWKRSRLRERILAAAVAMITVWLPGGVLQYRSRARPGFGRHSMVDAAGRLGGHDLPRICRRGAAVNSGGFGE
jgi:hypothetical protein